MARDLGKSYTIKKKTIRYPNGDIYEGMTAAYYKNSCDPHGEGTYYHKSSGVVFKADWEFRNGPDFNTIEIIDKPKDESFVLVHACASEIYSDLVYLGIIKAKEGTYVFKQLECIVLEPHAWSKHLFNIKKVNDNELSFDLTGPKINSEKFIDCIAIKGTPKCIDASIPSHIIWDHDDEYDVTINASIEVLYF